MDSHRCMRALPHSSILAILVCLWISDPGAVSAATWSFRSGEELPGDPVAFDFERKTLTIRNPVTAAETLVPTRNLSLVSRFRLLVSPLFHRGVPGESLWPPAKRRLLLFAVAIPGTVMFFVFWAAAWITTGRFNPLLAVIGYLGAWIILGIFTVCYAFLAVRFHGGPMVNLLGAVLAFATTPLYLSAVYNCSYGKAHLLLLSHLAAGLSLLTVATAAIGIAAGSKRLDAWSNRHVFEPVGLIAPEPETPRRAP